MTIFADYAYYSGTYGGDLIPEEKYPSVASKATDRINAATFGRIEKGVPTEHEEVVKRCCCELAEQIYPITLEAAFTSASGNSSSGIIASETNSKYSVSYRSSSEVLGAQLKGATAGLDDVCLAIILRHLGRTGLLFRGVDP